jgi:hypothetical protein
MRIPLRSLPSVIACGLVLALPARGWAQEPLGRTRIEIFGFAMMDMGYQVHQNDPAWFDVVRPTKLPSFENEFGADGQFFMGVRQTRFGIRTESATSLGPLKTIFDFDLFGMGANAGETTFHIRNAWGELGAFGAGRWWSSFVDIDIFPNSIEFWGPSGMVLTRNVQLRWTPVRSDRSEFAISVERPGGSADQGEYEDRVELEGMATRFPFPDVAAHYRRSGNWGHLQVAGIVRRLEWVDQTEDSLELGGGATGWGVNVTSNLKLGPHVLHLGGVYGEGVENYMNDAPVDVAIDLQPGDPVTPFVGKVLPVVGVTAFLDLNWNERYSTTLGYSMLEVENTDGQTADAFKKGQYALVNFLVHPVPQLLLGPELQYGRRDNFSDGFWSDDYRVQFSVKYSFSQKFGGN